MLPENYKLVVKEHPSMFSRGSEFKVRSIYNYQSILRLPNVVLSKMDMDNFKLIDHAKAVSTITGTVGLESYVMKRPVILFGRSVLNLKGVHGFVSIDKLQIFVDDVIKGRIEISDVENNDPSLLSHPTNHEIGTDNEWLGNIVQYLENFH